MFLSQYFSVLCVEALLRSYTNGIPTPSDTYKIPGGTLSRSANYTRNLKSIDLNHSELVHEPALT
jgi:hypothetical protein